VADPHLKISDSYLVYAQSQEVLIQKADGTNFEAESRPGKSVWIDFLNAKG